MLLDTLTFYYHHYYHNTWVPGYFCDKYPTMPLWLCTEEVQKFISKPLEEPIKIKIYDKKNRYGKINVSTTGIDDIICINKSNYDVNPKIVSFLNWLGKNPVWVSIG